MNNITTKAQEDLCDLLDKTLLEKLKDEPTAAMLNVARQRVRDLGINRSPAKLADDPADEKQALSKALAAELGITEPGCSVLKMPPVGEGKDAATA